MQNFERYAGIASALIAAFFFGLGNPFAKLATQALHPVVLLLLISAVSASSLTLIAVASGKKFTVFARDYKLLLGLGVLGFAIPSLMTMYAFQITSALSALFILRAEIFFAAIYGVLLFKERISTTQIFGILLGFFGVFVFATEFSFTHFNLGDLLLFVATIFWATYVVFVRKLSEKMDPTPIAAMRYWVGLPFFLLLILFLHLPVELPQDQFVNVAVLSFSTFIFGVIAYNTAISKIGVWKAVVPAQLFSVLFGWLFTWLILGETLSALKITGGALIMAGAFIAMRKGQQ